MPLDLAEPLLKPVQKELQHLWQVVAAYITLQTICTLTISIIGLPSTDNNGVASQKVKEPWYITGKIIMLAFLLNVLNYIIVNTAVCKAFLR